MLRKNILLVLILALTSTPLAIANNFSADARVQTYIQHLQQEHAFAPEELNHFFTKLTYNDKVLRLLGVPDADDEAKPSKPPKKVYWQQYRKQRLSAKKIASGILFYRQHQDLLDQAEAQYGVPAAIIAAIIGIETHYGLHTGRYLVAETLATLAFGHPQRGEEFLNELTEFLLYARETRIDPLSIAGSYAGAIGMAQFMPSSLRKHAVDFNGDERIDLFIAADAIASIANFLTAHGWQRGFAVDYPATIDSLQSKALIERTHNNDYRPVMNIEQLRQYGVQTDAPATGAHYLFVDLENRYDTEYRIGNENFYALTRYNKSFKYAAVVSDLAREIASGVN